MHNQCNKKTSKKNCQIKAGKNIKYDAKDFLRANVYIYSEFIINR